MIQQNSILKALKSDKKIIAINEIFHSLQGEGRFSGKPAIFIRANVCHVGCEFCDTKYTWENIVTNAYYTPESLYQQVIKIDKYTNWVVFTGGEPLEQPNLADSLEYFLSKGFTVQIETSGYIGLSVKLKKLLSLYPSKLYLVLSPKHLPVHSDFDTVKISDLKLLIGKDKGIADIQYYVLKYDNTEMVSLQPIDVDDESEKYANLNKTYDFVKVLSALFPKMDVRYSYQFNKQVGLR